MPDRWNDQTTCKFVELYREQEGLWNINLETYKIKGARQNALTEIVNNMGLTNFTVQDAIKKIKSLRATYNQEFNKIEKSAASGTDDLYKPPMKWFSAMSDVMKIGVLRRETFNNSIGSGDRQSSSVEKIEGAAESESQKRSFSATTKLRDNAPLRKKRSGMRSTVRQLKDLCETINKPEPEQNECDAFAAHIAQQLKKLSTSSCILVQSEIQNILTKFRLQDLQSHETFNSTILPGKN